MFRLLLVLLVPSLFVSCLVVPEGARPGVGLNANVLSQHNFRGIPNSARPVLQADMVVDLPTKLETGLISFQSWVNFDLTDDVGDAWFPDGHQGEPTQINLQASYSETYRGFDITSGVVSYALQNPDDFPFASERGETKELFVSVARPVPFEIVPSLTIHYDFDEVDDFYVSAAVAREFPIKEKLSADALVSVAYSGSDQSDWNYGLDEGGFADLQGAGRVSYFLDDHTTLHATLHGSTILDSELRDWFDVIDINADNVWIAIGVSWGY